MVQLLSMWVVRFTQGCKLLLSLAFLLAIVYVAAVEFFFSQSLLYALEWTVLFVMVYGDMRKRCLPALKNPLAQVQQSEHSKV